MAINKNIEEKIERALRSMDGHSRATPAPYLSTRINTKLSEPKVPNGWDKLYALITKPVIAIAGIAIILFLNIIIITLNDNADRLQFQAESNAEWQEYSTAATSALYDVENIEP